MLLHQRHYALVLRPDRRDRLNISLAVPPESSPARLPRRWQIHHHGAIMLDERFRL